MACIFERTYVRTYIVFMIWKNIEKDILNKITNNAGDVQDSIIGISGDFHLFCETYSFFGPICQKNLKKTINDGFSMTTSVTLFSFSLYWASSFPLDFLIFYKIPFIINITVHYLDMYVRRLILLWRYWLQGYW